MKKVCARSAIPLVVKNASWAIPSFVFNVYNNLWRIVRVFVSAQIRTRKSMNSGNAPCAPSMAAALALLRTLQSALNATPDST